MLKMMKDNSIQSGPPREREREREKKKPTTLSRNDFRHYHMIRLLLLDFFYEFKKSRNQQLQQLETHQIGK